jgi:hypothetical protein
MNPKLREYSVGLDAAALSVVGANHFLKFVRDVARNMGYGLSAEYPEVMAKLLSAKNDLRATSHAARLERSCATLLTDELKKSPTARSMVAGAAVFLLQLGGHAELAELFAQLLGVRSEANNTTKRAMIAYIDGIDARFGRPQMSVREMSQLMKVSAGSISGWRRTRPHQNIVKKTVSYPPPVGAEADWGPDFLQVYLDVA